MAEAEKLIQATAEDLFLVLSRFDPFPILGQITHLVTTTGGPDSDAYARHGAEARVQYLAGLAMATPAGPRLVPGPEEIQGCIDRVATIFDLEIAKTHHSQGHSSERHIEQVRRFLLMEFLTDRFQGYMIHLRYVIRELFEPLRDECESQVGWCPADLPDLAWAIRSVIQARLDDFHPKIHRLMHDTRPIDFQERVPGFLATLSEFQDNLYLMNPAEISSQSNLSEDTIRAALTSLTCDWGSQPSFRRPTTHNRFRRYGVLQSSADQFCILIPPSLIHEATSWFIDLLTEGGNTRLLERFYKARDAVTETITKDVLVSVFGSARVAGPLLYREGAAAYELDCLVDLPSDAIVVECKAHTLTDPGRRGAPDRLKKKGKQLVKTPFEQAQRAVEFIVEGHALFETSSGGRLQLAISSDARLPKIAVSFERVDPIYGQVADFLADNQSTGIWAVSLADLMMVTDILNNPASFFCYSTERMRQSNDPRFLLISEADLLGLHCDGGMWDLVPVQENFPNHQIVIGPGATAINSYYSRRSLGFPYSKPSDGVPIAIITALNELLEASTPLWIELAERVTHQPRQTWTRWRQAVRKARRARRGGKERSVDSESPRLKLTASREINHPSLTVTEDGVHWLSVPT